jgi:ELWxxDGT repeat protein
LELWATDGTASGTHLVKDINPGPESSTPRAGVVLGATLFFWADDGTHGAELWVTDGSAAGTHLVKDCYPGSNDSATLPPGGVAFGGKLFFTAISPDGIAL